MNKWLSKPINGLLLDITGVLYESGTTIAIAGSIEAIQKLRSSGVPFRLLTNETQKTTEKLLEKLNSMGYDFVQDEVITPAMICQQFLLKHKLRPHFLVHPNIQPEFGSFDGKNVNCVVLGDAVEYFSFQAMNNAFRLLMHLKDNQQHKESNCDLPLLIALGRNKYYREKGQLKMDLGGFTAALEYATDLQAKIIGKPSEEYFQEALNSFQKNNTHSENISKDNLIMIGDDIIGDIQGAQRFGIRGVLVRTGKYLPENENHPIVKPDAIVDNLLAAVEQILQTRSQCNYFN